MYTYYRGAQNCAPKSARGHCARSQCPEWSRIDPRGALAALGKSCLCAAGLGSCGRWVIAQIEHERDTWSAAVLGIIPFAIGVGYFLDFTLIRRDLQAS